MHLTLNDGSLLHGSIYGVWTDNGLFLDRSFDSATEKYYYSKVKSGHWSFQDFDNAMAQMYATVGEQTTTVTYDTQPSTTNALNTMSEISSYTTVSGTIQWIDDNNISHPMQYTKIEIFDKSSTTSLGTVYTDSNGTYSYYDNNPSAERSYSIFVYAAGENSYVTSAYGRSYYYMSTETETVSSGATVGISWTVDMSTNLGQAMQVSQAVICATRYTKAMNGTQLGTIQIKYPHNNTNKSGCFYDGESINIIFRNDVLGAPHSYACWDAIMHEYGHYVQDILNIYYSPGGQHSSEYNLIDYYTKVYKNHEIEINELKDHCIRLAWGEAWPTVFAIRAQQYYQAILQNIQTVCDTSYTSYNGLDYDIENCTTLFGEAGERSIMAILYDMYDSENETYDNLALGDTAMWNYLKNAQASSFSEFVQYMYSISNTYKTNLGNLLSFYKMSAILSPISSLQIATTPTISWSGEYGTTLLSLNKFDLIIYAGESNIELLKVSNLTSTSYTLTSAQWKNILNTYGDKFEVCVVAYQTDAPATGPYYSSRQIVTKPITVYETTENLDNYGNARYREQKKTLSPGCYFDYYVTSSYSGYKIIQTFGTANTVIEIYYSAGTTPIATSDNDGYLNNAFLRYYMRANLEYRIRVRMYDPSASGTFKLAINPAYAYYDDGLSSITDYDSIWKIENATGIRIGASTIAKYTSVLTFIPPSSGSYTFEIESDADTFIYVIDPRSTSTLTSTSFNNNGAADGKDAKLTKTLTAGIPYYVIFSEFDLSTATTNKALDLLIQKNN